MNTSSTKSADQIIRDHSWFSAVPGFFPVPLLDIAAITAVQLDMIRQLCKVYSINYSEQRGKSIVMALISATIGRVPGHAASSLVKGIPVVGWIAGGITLAFFARASTFATGMVFKAHFEEGGTLNDLNPDNFKKFYQEQYEAAKEVLDDYFNRKDENQDDAPKA